jgi:drug/metabolite transporter (DMT)-like permease
MTPAVTFAVLVAAFCHASWNAIIRRRGDKLVAMTLLVAACGVMAFPGLFFFPILPAAAWPFVITSALVHVGYNTFLALAYHHGELTKVYPLVRGSAPVVTLGISLLFLDEAVDASEAAGVIVVGAGIMVLAFDGGWRKLIASPHVLLYAAGTSLCITAYTLSDGLGARLADNAHQYVVWLFVLDMVPTIGVVLLIKGRAVFAAIGENWRPSVVGGALSLAAYWIVIWAFTVAPIPIVAALRETSILFALLIGMIWLGEKVTRVRAASIVLVLMGLALMRL